MMNREKNSAEKDYFSKQEEKIFSRVENAITENEVIHFESVLAKTFPSKRLARITWIKRAAVFVIVSTFAAITYHLYSPSNKNLFGQYYEQFSVENTSGFSRGEYNLKSEALIYFSGSQYNKASSILKQLLLEHPDDKEIQFLLAISFIETEQYQKALKYLNQIIEAPENFYTDDAQWYRALLQIRDNKFSDAKNTLNLIRSSSGYFPMAQELQEKIESK